MLRDKLIKAVAQGSQNGSVQYFLDSAIIFVVSVNIFLPMDFDLLRQFLRFQVNVDSFDPSLLLVSL